VPDFDQPERGQHPQCFPQRGPADTELFDEEPFRRQLMSGTELVLLDIGTDLFDDALAEPAPGDAAERFAARAVEAVQGGLRRGAASPWRAGCGSWRAHRGLTLEAHVRHVKSTSCG